MRQSLNAYFVNITKIKIRFNFQKKKTDYFFLINLLLILILFLTLITSLIVFPLPIPIFFTLVYTLISYILLFSYKFVENYSIIFKKCGKLIPNFSKKFIWTAFLVFLLFLIGMIFFLIIPFEKSLVDVDNAITSAVQGFINGINPYQEPIVPHHFQQGDVADIIHNGAYEKIFSTYNYLPLDLLLYSVFYYLLFPIVGNYWYFLTNIIVIFACIILFRIILETTIFKSIALFTPVIIFGGLILNDVWLIFFFIIFFYFYDRFQNYPFFSITCVLILTLGFLTKMLLIFLLPVFLIQNFEKWKSRFIYFIFSGLISTFFISLFNFEAVINSVFLFHSDIGVRGAIAYVGGFLAIPLEWFGINFLYIPLFILSFSVLLYTAPKYSKDLEGQMLYISALIILFLPSGNFIPFLLAVGIFGMFRIYKKQIKLLGAQNDLRNFN